MTISYKSAVCVVLAACLAFMLNKDVFLVTLSDLYKAYIPHAFIIGQIVMTKSELSEYNGSANKGLYLAIVGHVFDVTKGERHYAPGKGYGFFSGKDASRAYVTGDFTDEGLIDDVTGLTPSQFVDLFEWKKFYDNNYKFVGLVAGNFYNLNGEPKVAWHQFNEGVLKGHEEKKISEKENQLYPSCNSEWNQNAGSRVWCSERSGGVKRDWTGVPRIYYKPGSVSTRCACVRTSGTSADSLDSNNGDLGDPNFQIYEGCDPLADSCDIPNET